MSANVLVVDDTKSMRALISSVIESIGHTPIPAENGEEALGLYVEHDIDLVVLDVEMPGINGFETCRLLRSLKIDWIPVIYLSGQTSDDYIVNGLEAGGDAYVSKPVNPRVLESIIRAMGRIADMKQELRKANQELEKLAHYDGLTQIFNRRGFDETLERYWKQAQRENSTLSLILLDVDHFKLYNDHYGHLRGDDCLKQIAKSLDDNLLRPVDIASRYGGEEFALILPKTEIDGACSVAQRQLEAIQKLQIPHEHSSCSEHVTVSMGVTTNNDAKSIDELITNADQALYKSKESGRNQFNQFKPQA